MHWLGWLAVLLAIQEAGWLAFDGTRALVVGDYVTPRSGPYAGQLGAWSKLVARVGLEPRSTLVKSAHVLLGTAWLAMVICFALRLPWAWWGMLGCAIASLWYLPFGTLLSLIQIVVLLLPPVRAVAA